MDQYANLPVLFLEYDTDDPYDAKLRERRWWQSYGGSDDVSLPLVMVDSGNEISNGNVEFEEVYGAMVDRSLSRPPQGVIGAVCRPAGNNALEFDVQFTNQSGVELNYENDATIWVIVYEEFESPGEGRITNRFVRAVGLKYISKLSHESTKTYSVSIFGLTDWDNLRWVVLADFRPDDSTGARDTLQAYFSEDLISITKEWSGDSDAEWHNADNWNPAGIPDIEDQVEIRDSLNAPVIGAEEAPVQVHYLSVASGNLTVNGGPLTIQ